MTRISETATQKLCEPFSYRFEFSGIYIASLVIVILFAVLTSYVAHRLALSMRRQSESSKVLAELLMLCQIFVEFWGVGLLCRNIYAFGQQSDLCGTGQCFAVDEVSAPLVDGVAAWSIVGVVVYAVIVMSLDILWISFEGHTLEDKPKPTSRSLPLNVQGRARSWCVLLAVTMMNIVAAAVVQPLLMIPLDTTSCVLATGGLATSLRTSQIAILVCCGAGMSYYMACCYYICDDEESRCSCCDTTAFRWVNVAGVLTCSLTLTATFIAGFSTTGPAPSGVVMLTTYLLSAGAPVITRCCFGAAMLLVPLEQRGGYEVKLAHGVELAPSVAEPVDSSNVVVAPL